MIQIMIDCHDLDHDGHDPNHGGHNDHAKEQTPGDHNLKSFVCVDACFGEVGHRHCQALFISGVIMMVSVMIMMMTMIMMMMMIMIMVEIDGDSDILLHSILFHEKNPTS